RLFVAGHVVHPRGERNDWGLGAKPAQPSEHQRGILGFKGIERFRHRRSPSALPSSSADRRRFAVVLRRLGNHPLPTPTSVCLSFLSVHMERIACPGEPSRRRGGQENE